MCPPKMASMRPWCKVTIATFVLPAILACGHPSVSFADHSPPMGIPLAPKPKAWLTQPWTGDSRPFIAALNGIVAEGNRGGNTPATFERILTQERENARQHPLDLLAHVRWLYASTQVAVTTRALDGQCLETVAALDPGTFRTVARLRFLAVLVASVNTTHPEMDGLGERLVAAYPKDGLLRALFLADLAQGKETVPRAVALSDAWVRESPASPRSHGTRAYALLYRWIWSHQRDRTAAEQAVKEYQAFIRVLPPADKEDRAAAEDKVAVISQMAGLRPH